MAPATATAVAAAESEGLKKPPTAYFVWLNKNRATLEKQAPSKKGPDVAKYAGAMWKEMPEAEKQPYIDEAAAKKKEYDLQIAGGAEKFVSKKRKAKDEEKAAKKARKGTKAPTAYFLWLADNRERIVKEVGTGRGPVVAKEAGKQWAEVAESVKAKYQSMADEKKEALKAQQGEEAADGDEEGDEEVDGEEQ
mmetsp:Transcript_38033/g.88949  ORF Transcript_38033/g.88949 Transcript_38033/m.88949 type:complete len:193 (-) Transcript_38033:279-857(-)